MMLTFINCIYFVFLTTELLVIHWHKMKDVYTYSYKNQLLIKVMCRVKSEILKLGLVNISTDYASKCYFYFANEFYIIYRTFICPNNTLK